VTLQRGWGTMPCMSEEAKRKHVLSERIRLLANLCQTLGIGVLLLGIVAPLVGDGLPSLGAEEAVVAGAVALMLLLLAQRLIGDSVRLEP
jgi:hypothetical protein